MKLVRFCIQTILPFLIISNASGQVTADFEADVTSGCVPLTVRFTNKSIPTGATYHWDFGNGNTSLDVNPQATYTNSGNFTAKLTVTSSGVTKEKSILIRAFKKPVADFSADILKACVPQNVVFSNKTTLGDTSVQSWTWYFGDGMVDNLKDPNHTYNSEGKFRVYLEVLDNHGCSDKKEVDNYIDMAYPPTVGFLATPPEACNIPVTVSLKDQSFLKGEGFYTWSAGGTAVAYKKDTSLTIKQYGTVPIKLIVKDKTYGCEASAELQYLVSQVHASGELKQGATVIKPNGDIICAGDITFTSTSVPSEGTVYWDFGDSTDISTATTGTHRYTTGGPRTVRLIASPGSECADTLKWSFTVENVVPDFTLTPENSCAFSQTVQFKNTSQNAVSFEWKFADGSTSTQTDESRTYSVLKDKDPYVIHKDTFFTTTLKAISVHGCKIEKSKQFRIKRPTALFSVNRVSGCIPMEVEFKDISVSDSAITDYHWFFKDDESVNSDQTSIKHTYATAGDFSTRLIITDKNGCSDTSYIIPVRAGQQPVPGFSIPSPVCQNDWVQITDQTTGTATSWEYFLNDVPVPSCPDEGSPLFRFKPATGVLTVKQKVGYNGCFAETSKTITNTGPISKFVYEVKDCSDPYVYKFTGTPEAATSCKWEFGDGATSTSQVMDHAFPSDPANKDYQVKFITFNGACSDTMIQTVRVRQKIINLNIPDRACAYAPVSINAAGSQPLSSVCTEGYIWNFSDSTSVLRTDKEVIEHIFTKRGLFRVQVTAVHDNGCKDTLSKNIHIYKPYAGLKSDLKGGCPPLDVRFTNTSTSYINPIVKWEMNYGDTTSDVSVNEPSTYNPHPYIAPNYYTAYLKVTDNMGCADSAIIYIGIDRPDVALTIQNPNACANEDVIFVQTSSEIDSAFWDFGDNTKLSSTAGQVTHKYTEAGHYTAKLTVMKYGCPNIDVTPPDYIFIEKASATIIDSIADCPTLVKFTHGSPATNINTGEWDLGDGNIRKYNSKEPYTYHTYKPGNYTIKLTVTSDANKCTSTEEKTVKIPGPKGSFDISKINACRGDEIIFTVKDTADLTNFEFDYGDGMVDASKNLTLKHKYSESGKKYVALVLYQNSCRFSAKDSVSIDSLKAVFSVSDTAYCEGTPLSFRNKSIGQNGQSWDLGRGEKYPGMTPPDQNYPSGKYKIYLAVSSVNGCKDTARTNISVYPDYNFTVIADTSLCRQNKVLLKAEGGDIVRWWPKAGLNDSTVKTPVATPGVTTWYKAKTTSSQGGCSKKDSVLVMVPEGKLNVYGSLVTDTIVKIIVGDEIPIYITDTISVKSFRWQPQDYLTCTDCLNPVASPGVSLNYYLLLTEPSGCLTKTLHLGVLMDTTKMDWKAPDAFRPGTDEAGSYCMIHGKGVREILEFKIYNRWGNVVFSTTDKNSKGWDGKYQGKDQPVDSYVWTATVKMANNTVEKKKGTVLLLR